MWVEHAADLSPSWTGVDLDVLDASSDPGAAMRAAVEAHPDVLFGPYGSSTTLAAVRATDSSAHSERYARRTRTKTVSMLHGSTGFGQDVASGAASTARKMGFEVRTVSFEPGHAADAAATLPKADVLLVVGGR